MAAAFLPVSAVAQNPSGTPASAGAHAPSSAGDSTAANKALITIQGLCDQRPKEAPCETVITEEQFNRIVDAVQPGMSKRARREFADTYAEALILAGKAHELALDSGDRYREQMEVARVQILSQAMKKSIQDKASEISSRDIEAWYASRASRFERAEVERLFVPRSGTPSGAAPGNMVNANLRPDSTRGASDPTRDLAAQMRERAVAGEPFTRLEAEVYAKAGIAAVPSTSLSIRSTSLPPDQANVLQMQPGGISPIIPVSNGYVIYNLKAKELLPLSQVHDEIAEILRSERLRDLTRQVLTSVQLSVDESYFGR